LLSALAAALLTALLVLILLPTLTVLVLLVLLPALTALTALLTSLLVALTALTALLILVLVFVVGHLKNSFGWTYTTPSTCSKFRFFKGFRVRPAVSASSASRALSLGEHLGKSPTASRRQASEPQPRLELAFPAQCN
jgi:hypothetical protein